MTRDEELRRVRSELQHMLDDRNAEGTFHWSWAQQIRYDELCAKERQLLTAA